MASNTSDVDDLFRLPLPEFTAARNALAARLTAAGRGEAAAYVKGLTKPPLSPWVVNQLFWRHREAFDRLLVAGERLRTAQASQLRGKGADLRTPIEARRKALSELTKRAAAVLGSDGHAPTPDLIRRITTTLEALATYGKGANAPRTGHLTADVEPPGFEALAALVPQKGHRARGGARPRVLPFQQRGTKPPARKLDPKARKEQEARERKAQLAAASEAVRAAERALADARKVAAGAEVALKKAAALAKNADRKKEALAEQFERLTAEAEKARHEARRVAAAAEEAAQAVEDAERALDEAKRRRQSLTD